MFANATGLPATCSSLMDPGGISDTFAARSRAIHPPKCDLGRQRGSITPERRTVKNAAVVVRFVLNLVVLENYLKSVQFRDVNAVSAGSFGFVKHFVGFAHQLIEILDVATFAARDTESRRNINAVPRKRKRQRTKQFAKSIDRHIDVSCTYVRNHNQELISAKASTHIGNSRELSQSVRESSQNSITCLVTKGVVDLLEGIQVPQNH